MVDQSIRVLLIEDNPGDMRILEAALERAGKTVFELDTAGRLDDGLKLLANGGYDALLLDLGLPDSFGVDTVNGIRKQDARIPIVIVTVSEDEETALEALKNGAQDYLVKSEITGNVVVRSIKYAMERKRGDDVAQQAMTEEKGMLRQILEYAPVGMVRLDQDSTVVDVNQAMTVLIGFPAEQLIGRNLFTALPIFPAADLKRAIVEGRPLRIESQRAGASEVGEAVKYWDLAEWPIKGHGDEGSETLLVVKDVSDMVKLSQQREDMMATLAHDLKTPLIGVDRALGLLLDGVLGELKNSQAEVIAMVRKSNTDFLNRIKTLLEVLRYESAHPELFPEEIDMSELVKECLAELVALADQYNVTINTASSQDCFVVADRRAVKRLVVNLLDNAIKFSPPAGTVEISMGRQGNKILIEVRDTGIGISEADIPKLFQRFWQGEPGKRYPAGTGLGLYLCQRIVKVHKGKIICKSKVKEGTTFSVTIPDAMAIDEEMSGPARIG